MFLEFRRHKLFPSDEFLEPVDVCDALRALGVSTWSADLIREELEDSQATVTKELFVTLVERAFAQEQGM